MARASRASKSTKTTKTPTRNQSNLPSEEQVTESRRKSLRSSGKALSTGPSNPQTHSLLVSKSPVATRSTRKRISVSSENLVEEKIGNPQAERGPKRRRTAASTASASPEQSKVVPSSAPLSVRKRRGAQKESPSSPKSPPPSAPATKRAKFTSTVSSVSPSTPKTRSNSTIKRPHQPDSSSDSEANNSRQVEDKKSSPSQNTMASGHLKRSAKRSRKDPIQSPSPIVESKKHVNLTQKRLTPSKSRLIKAEKEDAVLGVVSKSKNGDKESKSKKSPNKKESVKLKKHEPVKPLTKGEIEALQRRLLFSRLDHDDLSDLISVSDLLSKWPEEELRSPVTDSSAFHLIPASHRLWISESTNPLVRNGECYDCQPNFTLKESVELEIPHAKRARRNMSPESNGGGGAEVQQNKISNVGVSDAEEYPKLLDTFCVASFTISPKSNAEGDVTGEFSQILEEIADIFPDVFCIKQLSDLSAAMHLKSELDSQGYQCSGCSSMEGATQSFIYFNREVFSEVSTHRRSVQSMARNLVEQSAYPQLWRDALIESLTAVKGAGDASNQSQLLVSVLRHTSTGSLLLFSCLTDRIQAENGSISLTPVVPTTTCTSMATVTIPHVEGCFISSSTPTITISVAGSHLPKTTGSANAVGCEWSPRSLNARPDLAAINATGCMWALKDVWDNVQESLQPLVNGGFNGHSSVPTMRWVLCANLEASPTSPVYQILRDGYPSDESIVRLRAMRNVHLKDHDFFEATTLLDRLWHAFQHTCTDVHSCYQTVMGSEPPFTRYTTKATSPTPGSSELMAGTVGVEPRKCVDYIFCSGSSLHPREVLIPPCRAILGSTGSTSDREGIFSLASKIGIIDTYPESSLSAQTIKHLS